MYAITQRLSAPSPSQRDTGKWPVEQWLVRVLRVLGGERGADVEAAGTPELERGLPSCCGIHSRPREHTQGPLGLPPHACAPCGTMLRWSPRRTSGRHGMRETGDAAMALAVGAPGTNGGVVVRRDRTSSSFIPYTIPYIKHHTALHRLTSLEHARPASGWYRVALPHLRGTIAHARVAEEACDRSTWLACVCAQRGAAPVELQTCRWPTARYFWVMQAVYLWYSAAPPACSGGRHQALACPLATAGTLAPPHCRYEL